MTREEAGRLIALHEKEHAVGEAYAYAILTPDGARELGCVYLRRLAPFLERTRTRLTTGAVDPGRTAIVTFWLIDDEAARPSTARVLDSLREWVRRWDAADVVFRCLPAERESVGALTDALGLQLLSATDQELPYLWFAEQAAPSVT